MLIRRSGTSSAAPEADRKGEVKAHMYETKEDYERLRKQFIEEYKIDEATEEFFQVLYKKRLQYHLIIAVLSSLVLLLLLLRLLEM